jgi:hypothetical protein
MNFAMGRHSKHGESARKTWGLNRGGEIND